jgi:hypothetical protein
VIDPVDVLQSSVVQALPSLIVARAVCVINPLDVLQASVVQALLSSIGIAVCVIDPVDVSQKSVVQALLSVFTTATWVTDPVDVLQASVVQEFPSLIAAKSVWVIEPVNVLHASSVQALPSLTFTTVWVITGTGGVGFVAVIVNEKPSIVPPSKLAASTTVNNQVPFGFSPLKLKLTGVLDAAGPETGL